MDEQEPVRERAAGAERDRAAGIGNAAELDRADRAYRRSILLRNAIVIAFCCALFALAVLVGANTGHSPMSPGDVMRTLLGGGSAKENLILFEFRLPRVLIAAMVGAALALSGCIIQGVVRNPLADPGLLGINAGASLVVIVYLLVAGTVSFAATVSLAVLAFVGALAAAGIVYAVAYKRGEGVSPMRLVLVGVGVQAGITALTTLLSVRLDETQFTFVATFQAGSVWGSTMAQAAAMAPLLIVLACYACSRARTLDAFCLGEDVANALGVAVERQRMRLLLAAVALAATAVAAGGSIGFVGLIAPHLSRRLVGPGHRILLPVCALVGAALVCAADTLGRVIMPSGEIPAGVAVAVIGAPYFLYLLAKMR